MLQQFFYLVPFHSVINTVVYIKAQALCFDLSTLNSQSVIGDVFCPDPFLNFIVAGYPDYTPEIFPCYKSFGKADARGDIKLIVPAQRCLAYITAAAQVAAVTKYAVCLGKSGRTFIIDQAVR